METRARTVSLVRRGVTNLLAKRPFCISFEVTYNCNAQCGHCHLGGAANNPREVRAPAERFGELARMAEATGARVALEPHVAAVVSRVERALYVLDEVGHDALGLNLDISHFAVQGVPTADAVRALAPRAFVSEVKDQRGIEPDFDFLIPGEGDFDYVEFLREMDAAGYDGSVSVEVSVFRQRIDGYDPYEAAVTSYAVLAQAFSEAGIERPRKAAREGMNS